ncbi:MAG: DUF4124 domain-containing protein [Luteimonas sp.]|nr:DUF4124 domain-containing protein [Luteimonas sp.]
MRRSPVPILLGLALLCLSASASAQEVYQWKDANGVTHYSQTPPDRGQQYQQRAITQQGATQPQAVQQTASATESPQCTAARKNLDVLKGNGPVHETDADGKPGRTLSDAERTSQTDLANAAIRAYCTPAG